MNKKDIEKIKKAYPIKTKIILDFMDDIQAPPIGTIGTIIDIDDTGALLVRWSNGSSLKIFPNIDKFHIL